MSGSAGAGEWEVSPPPPSEPLRTHTQDGSSPSPPPLTRSDHSSEASIAIPSITEVSVCVWKWECVERKHVGVSLVSLH